MHTPDRESPLHEHEAIRLRAMIHFFIWFIVVAVIIHVLVWFVYVGYRGQAQRQSVPITGLSEARIPPPGPRLQPSAAHDRIPRVDMEQLRGRELAEFKRRGWVDEKTGTVRVPDQIAQQVTQMTQPPATRNAR